MATLANQTISSTYDGLIKTSTDQPVPISGVQLLEDGVGNSLALSVGRANQGVTVTGTLSATSITGVLADGVTATTQTLGDNSTKVATTAYVDAQVTASDLDFAGDTGTGAVDLDSQTFTIAGTANEIETVASGQTVTIGLPSSVTVGTLTATTLAGTLSTAAQPNITSVGTLSSLAVSGNLTVDTNTLYVDAANDRVGIGTSNPAYKLDVRTISVGVSQSGAVRFGANDQYGMKLEQGSTVGGIPFANIVGPVDANAQLGFKMGASSTEVMRITPSGNVGIGTSSPARQLTVQNSGNAIASIRSGNTSASFLLMGDTDSDNIGMLKYDNSDNSMQFYAGSNSSERMRIDSSGNVGIGSSSPVGKFEVNVGSSAAYFTRTAGNNGGSSPAFGILTDSTGNRLYSWGDGMKFYTSAVGGSPSERMRIDSSGNVGIGTTPASTVALDIKESTVGTDLILGLTAGTGARSQIRSFAQAGSTTSELGFYTVSGNTYERMRIDSSGNVGIGTSSPTRQLEVSKAGTAYIRAADTTNSVNVDMLAASSGGWIGTQSNHNFLIQTNNTERMRITSGGNVGIGTTSPSALLQITGPNAAGNFFIANNDGAAGAIFKRENASSFPYNTYSFLNGYVGINTSSPQTGLHVVGGIRFSSSGADANRWSVYWNGSSGDLIVVNNISDIRAKKDLDYNIKGLETVQKLKPVKFTWKDGTSHSTSVSGRLRQYGFIAQETMEADDYLAWHNEEQDTWGIEQYESFSAVMVKAIQEQQEIINDLKSRIETLENK